MLGWGGETNGVACGANLAREGGGGAGDGQGEGEDIGATCHTICTPDFTAMMICRLWAQVFPLQICSCHSFD